MRNATLKFLPLFIFYLLLVIVFSSPTFWGDEGVYVKGSELLSEGLFYSNHDITLMWGPGTPFWFLLLC